jgi:hypothetical protein
MAQIDAMGASRSRHGPVRHRKDHPVALIEGHDLGSRLPAWPLLGHHEFVAREVPSRRREQHSDLQREDVFPVEVLMQAGIVALAVLKKERGRPGLAGPMATLEEGRMITRIAGGSAHGLTPAVRDGGERRIERGPQFRDDIGQWIGEVFVALHQNL